MQQTAGGLRFRQDLLRDAALTLGAVVLAFLALDDITTDTVTSFVIERTALALCGLWLVIVAWRLLGGGHPVLGAISAVVVAAAVAAQPAIGPGTVPSFRFEYVATAGALVWFLGLAGILASLAWRSGTRRAA